MSRPRSRRTSDLGRDHIIKRKNRQKPSWSRLSTKRSDDTWQRRERPKRGSHSCKLWTVAAIACSWAPIGAGALELNHGHHVVHHAALFLRSIDEILHTHGLLVLLLLHEGRNKMPNIYASILTHQGGRRRVHTGLVPWQVLQHRQRRVGHIFQGYLVQHN